MAYRYKSTLSSAISLGSVAYEVLAKAVIVPGTSEVLLKFDQYTSGGVRIRRRTATISVPRIGLRNTLNSIMAVARNQGVAQAGTDSYQETSD